jgi:hypothetical protein
MSRSNAEFGYPHQIKGNAVQTRFGLRRESKTRKPKDYNIQDATAFSYQKPGRGVNGESSN